AYLRPLLGTPGEIRSAHAEREAFSRPTPTTQYDTVMLENREPVVEDEESSELVRKPVPIRGLRHLEVDIALNLYLDRPPSSTQLARLVATLDAWYADG